MKEFFNDKYCFTSVVLTVFTVLCHLILPVVKMFVSEIKVEQYGDVILIFIPILLIIFLIVLMGIKVINSDKKTKKKK